MKQNTLGGSFTLQGKGLHTGLNLTVTFNPAPVNHGYKIQRIDLPDAPIIEAVAENVVETTRGTVLAQGDARCSTVEHALAALYALGIDNCLMQVDGPEVPILDGSAEIYVEHIQRVGRVEQDADRIYFEVTKEMEVRDEKSGSSLSIAPADHFGSTTTIAFPGKVLSNQTAELTDMSLFPQEIAAARTFCFVREVEMMLAANLIKGGDLDNAIVIYEMEKTQEELDLLADRIGAPHRKASELGYIQTKPLMWDNEPARHKLLDIIGDMALVGRRIHGHISAIRPGHTINNRFARLLRQELNS